MRGNDLIHQNPNRTHLYRIQPSHHLFPFIVSTLFLTPMFGTATISSGGRANLCWSLGYGNTTQSNSSHPLRPTKRERLCSETYTFRQTTIKVRKYNTSTQQQQQQVRYTVVGSHQTYITSTTSRTHIIIKKNRSPSLKISSCATSGGLPR